MLAVFIPLCNLLVLQMTPVSRKHRGHKAQLTDTLIFFRNQWALGIPASQVRQSGGARPLQHDSARKPGAMSWQLAGQATHAGQNQPYLQPRGKTSFHPEGAYVYVFLLVAMQSLVSKTMPGNCIGS